MRVCWGFMREQDNMPDGDWVRVNGVMENFESVMGGMGYSTCDIPHESDSGRTIDVEASEQQEGDLVDRVVARITFLPDKGDVYCDFDSRLVEPAYTQGECNKGSILLSELEKWIRRNQESGSEVEGNRCLIRRDIYGQ